MTKNVDLLTHSPKYRVGEFDVDPTRYPRGKWGFSNKNPTSRVGAGDGGGTRGWVPADTRILLIFYKTV